MAKKGLNARLKTDEDAELEDKATDCRICLPRYDKTHGCRDTRSCVGTVARI